MQFQIEEGKAGWAIKLWPLIAEANNTDNRATMQWEHLQSDICVHIPHKLPVNLSTGATEVIHNYGGLGAPTLASKHSFLVLRPLLLDLATNQFKKILELDEVTFYLRSCFITPLLLFMLLQPTLFQKLVTKSRSDKSTFASYLYVYVYIHNNSLALLYL